MARRESKAKTLRKHARKRAWQRHGVVLSNNDQRQLVGLIQKGRGEFVERQSRRVSVHDVEWNGVVMRCVYDKLRGELVTVLPPSPDVPASALLPDGSRREMDHAAIE